MYAAGTALEHCANSCAQCSHYADVYITRTLYECSHYADVYISRTLYELEWMCVILLNVLFKISMNGHLSVYICFRSIQG